jgi:P4 family phage/plasmid primase-like protien
MEGPKIIDVILPEDDIPFTEPEPNKIKFKDLKFCKIRKGTKKPFEEDWVNKPYTWDQIQDHVKAEQNYGVLCGYEGLVVIDADSKEVRDQVDKELPPTFKVETGSKGFHYYFICKEIKKKIVLQTAEKHYGEIQSTGSQVVGPGSLHPSGNIYKVVNESDIVELTKEQLFTVMKPFMKDVAEQEAKAIEELKNYSRKFGDSDINSIAISDVVSITGWKRANNGEFYGVNPWHGSSTGMNTWINPYKNLGHCFRCDCGFNVAQAIGLQHGIITSCYDKLSGPKFMEVLKIAQEQYGLKKPEDIKKEERMVDNIKKVIDNWSSKENLAKQLYQEQPYFYDSVRNWWLWNHDERFWLRKDETDILNMVNTVSLADTIKSKERVEILEAMKQEGRKRVPIPVKPTWIQFRDKIVDVDDGSILEASPKYFVTNPIPWSMHEDCEDTPNMDKIFDEWVGKDNVLLLYQILSFALLPDYPINRLFCFIGPGMNGKSKYLELLARFVGKNNITSTELDILLESRFEISRLHKKLVCVMGETNFAEMSKTSMLKKLTGGDLIGFEYKGKDPFDDKNYAKILISTNNLPTTTDKTIGFYRRWLIADFPNQFTEKKDILKDIPDEEYRCLARKSIKILKALLIDRTFHNEGSVEDRMKKFEDKSNPFDKFWKEFIEEDGSKFIWKFDFEKKFNQWCLDNRFRNFSEMSIGMKMKERGIETIRREADWFTDGQKKSLRAWVGITWKDNKK